MTADPHFCSDNTAGAHPQILDALVAANEGAALAYGADALTHTATKTLQRHFGADARVCFVFGGTGANIVALGAVLQRHEAIVCAETSHLYRDECGAPEALLGAKLVPVPTEHGKLHPDAVAAHLAASGGVHSPRPRVLSISQATEWGTVYTPSEVRALAELAHAHDALLHIDGARLANAAASLGCSLAELSIDAGADVISCGGTKNGMVMGEAVIFATEHTAPYAGHVRKQCTQLPSKLRFVAAQFQAAFCGDLWLRCARHANTMAQRLAAGVQTLPGARLAAPVQTNAVFVQLPPTTLSALQRQFTFHRWDPLRPIARWMTSFATTEQQVDAFVATVHRISERA